MTLNLQSWRERKGFTQAELAAALGVTRQTVIRWESGARAPLWLPYALGMATLAPPLNDKPMTPASHPEFYERVGKHHVRRPSHPSYPLNGQPDGTWTPQWAAQDPERWRAEAHEHWQRQLEEGKC